MSSSNDRSAAVKKLKALNFAPKIELKDFRAKFEDTFSDIFLPNRVEAVERDFGGVSGILLNPEIYSSHKIMIYIHGGSFVGGSPKAYLPFVAALAHATSCKTVVPDFRLAPSHPYPAALEDVQNVFKSVYTDEVVAQSLNAESEQNAKPEIIIAADDSGASIALALILSLKGRFRSCIGQVILLSPWLDISPESSLLSVKKAKDEILTNDAMRRCAELYTYYDNRKKPYVSPLLSTREMLEDFPPVFIQMGEKEILLDDAICFQTMLNNNGIECQLDVWPDMMHMFQLADEYLNESHLAVEKIGHLIADKKMTKADYISEMTLDLEKSSFVSSEEL